MQTREMSFHDFTLPKLVVAVQLANQRSAILGTFVRQCGNEGFDQVTAGVAERFGLAEISRIGFHEGRMSSYLRISRQSCLLGRA